MTPPKMTAFLFAVVATSLVACGPKANNLSAAKFAYYHPESSIGGPLGRLEAVKLGYSTDFNELRVCIETGLSHFSTQQIVLEAELAYAAWLDAAGTFTENDWQRFSFEPQPKCRTNDQTYSANIVIERLGNIAPDETILSSYQEQAINCSTDGHVKKCSGNIITLGWGGPGFLTTWYVNDPNQWTKLTKTLPSTTTLSPYVEWLSLDEELARNTDPNLTAARRATLRATYQTLAETMRPSFAALTGFAKSLADLKLKTTDDPVFAKLVQDFYASQATAMNRTYRGQRAAFSSLLHEVGHQFGMDHADNPKAGSLTGASSDAHKDADGQWTTKSATMAYGLPYMYLTDDDAAGAEANRVVITDYLRQHL